MKDLFRELLLLIVSLILLLFTANVFALEIQHGISRYNDNQKITFKKAFSTTPVIITSGQKGTGAYSTCAIDNSKSDFKIRIQDHNGAYGTDVWIQWIAIVPNQDEGVIGKVEKKNSDAYIEFSSPLSKGPVILTNAQSSGKIYRTCAVGNSQKGFTLAMLDHEGKKANIFR